MSRKEIRIEPGAWTPALRVMGLEIMDELMERPISFALKDPQGKEKNIFLQPRAQLSKNKYDTVEAWGNEVLGIIRKGKEDNINNLTIVEICDELERWFQKRFLKIKDYSEFKFRTLLTNAINEVNEIIKEKEVETSNDSSMSVQE